MLMEQIYTNLPYCEMHSAIWKFYFPYFLPNWKCKTLLNTAFYEIKLKNSATILSGECFIKFVDYIQSRPYQENGKQDLKSVQIFSKVIIGIYQLYISFIFLPRVDPSNNILRLLLLEGTQSLK